MSKRPVLFVRDHPDGRLVARLERARAALGRRYPTRRLTRNRLARLLLERALASPAILLDLGAARGDLATITDGEHLARWPSASISRPRLPRGARRG